MAKKTTKKKGTLNRNGNPRHPASSTVKVRESDGRVPSHSFAKGNPGKLKGTKDKVKNGRIIKASIKAILQDIVETKGKTIEKAILDGITGGPRNAHHYIKMAAEYLDGKPADTINLNNKYDEDEIAAAKERLGKKIDKMLLQYLPPVPEEGDGQ